VIVHFIQNSCLYTAAKADPGRAIGATAPPKTYESNIFNHDFVQLRKTFGCQRRLDIPNITEIPPPLNLRAGSAPGLISASADYSTLVISVA